MNEEVQFVIDAFFKVRARSPKSQDVTESASKVYKSLESLENLILQNFELLLPFQQRIGGKLVPSTFLATSLKRLFIPTWRDQVSDLNLSARNCIWLLSSCSLLHEASLAFDISIQDFDFPLEFKEAFSGLSSVKKLALQENVVGFT